MLAPNKALRLVKKPLESVPTQATPDNINITNIPILVNPIQHTPFPLSCYIFILVDLLPALRLAKFLFSCYASYMTMTQTVEITANRRTVKVPREIPAGATIITFTPAALEATVASSERSPASGTNKSEQGINAALRRAQGAWKDNPWTNHLEDVNATRNEWDQRK